jgi:hypothetical protein
MGLDQYAFQVVTELPEEAVPHAKYEGCYFIGNDDPENMLFPEEVDEKPTGRYLRSIQQWRKHPNLQGFMAHHWAKATGEKEGDFNCVKFPLTVELIDELEISIKNDLLPDTEGFFFGGRSDDLYEEQDLEFCKKAREILTAGGEVLYDSWW